jgi:hypothetical protein
MSRVKTAEPSGATLICVLLSGPIARQVFQAGNGFHLMVG